MIKTVALGPNKAEDAVIPILSPDNSESVPELKKESSLEYKE